MIEIQSSHGSDIPNAFAPAIQLVGALFQTFQQVTGFVPSHRGADLSEPDGVESPVDVVTARIGSSRVSWLAEGVGNLHYAGSRTFYNEIEGGAGIQVELTPPGDPGTLIAVRVTPIYGEIAWYRAGSYSTSDPSLPTTYLLGSGLGLDAERHIGPLTAGLRVDFHTQSDIHSNATRGLAMYDTVYLRFDLRHALELPETSAPLSITASFDTYDRGEGLDGLYSWGGNNGLNLSRQGWDAMIHFNWGI